ncbi:MAG: ISNCY family transposase [Alphaproteobacteria bacterium]|nr:ISNCY family transposase [Alphaproteobacteria bacterium]
MRFNEIMGRHQSGRLSCEEAADVLGISVSSFYRWRRRFETKGVEGLADGRIGKASGRRAGVDEVVRMLELYETRYFDLNVAHFHEKLADHGIARGYTWTKNTLQAAGKVAKAKKRGAHRRRRPRKPLPGMMLHQDGSRHEWTPGQWWDLIVTMDDATSEIYSAFFVAEEGTASSMRGIHEVIARFGLFCSLYTDRGSHYWVTTEAGKVDKDNPTQVKRALDQLGIELIPAYSPEARGRSERTFGTIQGRLPQELRLAGITDMEAANRFLADVFIPESNRRFREKPAEEGTAFVPWAGTNLADILCIQEERTVGNDNTVRYLNRILQIPADRHRHHYVKSKVRVHEYPDGALAVFHGPRRLASFDVGGVPIADPVVVLDQVAA